MRKRGEKYMFLTKGSLCPMARNIFLTKVNKIVKDSNLLRLQGHGIHVGFTVEYLLCSIPFNIVKVKGCWQQCCAGQLRLAAGY